MLAFLLSLLLSIAAVVCGVPQAADDLIIHNLLHARAGSPYTPRVVTCPSTPLVRTANGIGSEEAAYIAARKPKSDVALAAWLASTGQTFASTSYPVVGLTTSGGGLRSLLTGAGVHQALDKDDSNVSTSGLYQAISYEAGLSGGGWLLSSLASNNWPTVSSLQKNLWNAAFNRTLVNPPNPTKDRELVGLEVLGKHSAGYKVGITDIYGRLLGYQLLYGKDGGVKDFTSGITGLSNFTSYEVPYPIFTALGVENRTFIPPVNSTQYEFHPYEFGSWDQGVQAFTPIKYLGSNLTNGVAKQCVQGFDSQSFVLGTSSSIFSYLRATAGRKNADIQEFIAALKELGLPTGPEIFFAVYPNPFHKLKSSPAIKAMPRLNLIDGGEGDQGDPIWPMLHRNVDVLIVGANSADTSDNFPSGIEIRTTYEQAKANGLTRMPFIPTSAVFAKQGLNKRPTFFGCDEPSAMTIVYLANRDISYNSGTSTFQLQYTKAQTAKMIANGASVATNDGDAAWGTCLGCAIMKKAGGTLPAACTACFTKYCYKK